MPVLTVGIKALEKDRFCEVRGEQPKSAARDCEAPQNYLLKQVSQIRHSETSFKRGSMTREQDFQHAGRSLTVRAAIAGESWIVAVFEGESRATPVTYNVSLETCIDAMMQGSIEDIVSHLMLIAETDVTTGRVPLISRDR